MTSTPSERRQRLPRGNRRPKAAARGVSLVEVLVSCAVLAIGLMALLRLQVQLHTAADHAAQRAQAALLAQAQLEAWRGFAVLEPPAGEPEAPAPALRGTDTYRAIAAFPEHAVTLAPAGVYSLSAQVTEHTAPRRKDVAVSVRWSDRSGAASTLTLASIIAGVEPALPGSGPAPTDASTGQPGGDAAGPHPGIPPGAVALPGGQRVFRPAAGTDVAWVFDAATGAISAVCRLAGPLDDAARPGHLHSCTSRIGWSVSGHIRFATQPAAADARAAGQPAGAALDLDLCLSAADPPRCTDGLDTTGLAACFDDAPAVASPARTSVRFHCAAFPPPSQPAWSGRLDVVPRGWTLAGADVAAGTGNAYTVCRYSADHDRNGRIDPAEHPPFYEGVSAPLFDQNFLVVRAGTACPRDLSYAPGAPHPHNPVDDSTVQHQP